MPTRRYDYKVCTCGSGLQSSWQHDARGIELCRTCIKCHDMKMQRYRRDVLTDQNYPTTEQIDED